VVHAESVVELRVLMSSNSIRRAKIKLLAKKHLENGEDLDSIPESMRQYLAMQAMESGKGLSGSFLGRSSLLPYGGGVLMGGDPTGQSKVRK
jgi:hypothetical protein